MNNIVLDRNRVMKAMQDPGFYSQVPEFGGLKSRIVQANSAPAPKQGCASCQQRAQLSSLFSAFVRVVDGLGPDGIRRLKQYLGVDALTVSATDPITGAVKVRTL